MGENNFAAATTHDFIKKTVPGVKGRQAENMPESGDIAGRAAENNIEEDFTPKLQGWLLKRNSKVGGMGWNRTWDWRFFGFHRSLGLYYSWKALTEPVIMGMKSLDVRLNWKHGEVLDACEKEGKNPKHEIIISFKGKDVTSLRVRCKDKSSMHLWLDAVRSLRSPLPAVSPDVNPRELIGDGIVGSFQPQYLPPGGRLSPPPSERVAYFEDTADDDAPPAYVPSPVQNGDRNHTFFRPTERQSLQIGDALEDDLVSSSGQGKDVRNWGPPPGYFSDFDQEHRQADPHGGFHGLAPQQQQYQQQQYEPRQHQQQQGYRDPTEFQAQNYEDTMLAYRKEQAVLQQRMRDQGNGRPLAERIDERAFVGRGDEQGYEGQPEAVGGTWGRPHDESGLFPHDRHSAEFVAHKQFLDEAAGVSVDPNFVDDDWDSD